MKRIYISMALFILLGCSYEEKNEYISSREAAIVNISLQSIKPLEGTPTNKAVSSEVKQPEKIILDVPLIKQKPELKYGCEVTSLAMVLQYAGVHVNKMTLAKQIKKDVDPKVHNKRGDIISWGNPADGFVGDMTGKTSGYAVYDEPITELMEKYLPERAINLTGHSFDELLKYVANKRPVVVWTTGDYRLPDRWESWKHGGQTIRTPLDLHAVVLVGFDKHFVYINDPLSGKKAHKVAKHQFIDSWIALRKRAVSYN